MHEFSTELIESMKAFPLSYVYGIPACGKSFFASILRENGFEVVEIDEIRNEAGGFSNDREFSIFKKIHELVLDLLLEAKINSEFKNVVIVDCLYPELLILIDYLKPQFFKIQNKFAHTNNYNRNDEIRVPETSFSNLQAIERYCEDRYVKYHFLISNHFRNHGVNNHKRS